MTGRRAQALDGDSGEGLLPQAGVALNLTSAEQALRREQTARQSVEKRAEALENNLQACRGQLELLQTIASAANNLTSVEKALRFVIDALCDHFGWAVGHAWRIVRDPTPLPVSTGIWHADDEQAMAPFLAQTQRLTFSMTHTLPGRVLRDKTAHLVPDIFNEPEFIRREQAIACGLRAGFAFPVISEGEVWGVLEFFSRTPFEEQPDLLGFAGHVGNQIGWVVERRRAEEKLIHEAMHDPLTGLANRALYTQRVEDALARRVYGNRFATLFLDLDRFKFINDSLGHAAGDQLLVECARRLKSALEAGQREARAAGRHWPRWVLARLGGDEFTVLLDEMANGAQAVEIGEMLLRTLEPPHRLGRQQIVVASSIGLAYASARHTAVGELMRDADLAMYEAKAQGRGRLAIFDERLHLQVQERLQIETDLRRTVAESGFELHYQPIMALAEERDLVGFEALLRWRRHPDRPLMHPSDFITVAEETGLVLPIGTWVLEEACGAAVAWNAALQGMRPSVAVNISGRQFMQPDFLHLVARAIERTGIDPRQLKLELTETVAIMDVKRTAELMSTLRGWGVGIGLDDFGTGYSSLSYLHKLPFDTLKIDRSFVTGMEHDPVQQVIVGAVIDIARSLGQEVIVEGVETAEECARLRDMGCTIGQGYYLSPPLSPQDVTTFLAPLVAAAAAP